MQEIKKALLKRTKMEMPIMEPVIFEDGFLNVDRANQVLQEFLHYHPGNGMIYEEINHGKDAAEELEVEELVLDAQVLARI